jgi:hypothetical protein
MKDKAQLRKKRKNSIIIQLVVGSIIGGAIGFFGAFYGFDRLFENNFTFIDVLLFLAFIFIGGFIQINIHEFGHFIFGKVSGYSLISYRIGAFAWNNENGKMKFSIIKNKGYDGLCAMIPPEQALPVYKEILYYSGGILLNLLSGIIFIVISAVIPDIGAAASLFLIALGSVGIIFGLVNFIPFMSLNNPSDGKIIWSKALKNPFSEQLVKINKMSSQLSAGVRPGDMDLPAISNIEDPQPFDLTIMLFSYFKALDNDNKDDMQYYIGLLEENQNLFPHVALPSLMYELCYMACIAGDESRARAYFEKGGKILQKDKDINGLRVKAYYAYNINRDLLAAEALCKEALAVADKYPIKGQGLLEESLVKKLLVQIEQG